MLKRGTIQPRVVQPPPEKKGCWYVLTIYVERRSSGLLQNSVTEHAGTYEVALSRGEIDEIFAHCGTEALLVGGQALAVWADYFHAVPTDRLADSVTLDADFIGSKLVASNLSKALGWKLYLPSVDDATPCSRAACDILTFSRPSKT